MQERPAPVDRYPQQLVWWTSKLEARALPEGILPRSKEEGFDDFSHLISFFRLYSGGRVLIGNLGDAKPYFRFSGTYSPSLCRWIKSELLSNPTCLLSVADELVLIADEQLRYSSVSATPQIIAALEDEWGGANKLRDAFLTYVENGEIGFDDDDREWAKRFLTAWSGW
jgi:hypothetical protein